jgi:hypothetical protein
LPITSLSFLLDSFCYSWFLGGNNNGGPAAACSRVPPGHRRGTPNKNSRSSSCGQLIS